MQNNVKIGLLESVNLLSKNAHNGDSILPKNICQFLVDEFHLSYALLARETNENIFSIIGQSSQKYLASSIEEISVQDYKKILDRYNFDDQLISHCSVSSNELGHNSQSHIIFLNENLKYLIIVEHKILPTVEESQLLHPVYILIQSLLRIWNKSDKSIPYLRIGSFEFLDKSLKGIRKEIKTNNGLLTLIKEERLPNSAENYFKEIKFQNSKAIKSVNELRKLIELDSEEFVLSESPLNFDIIIKESINEIKSLKKNLVVDLKNNISGEIIFDREILTFILDSSLGFISNATNSTKIDVKTQKESNSLLISFCSKSINIDSDKLNLLTEPFEASYLSKSQSGLVLSLLTKYVELLNGTYKFTNDPNNFCMNLSIPIKTNDIPADISINDFTQGNGDKVLVIESDQASTSLLKNHLRKWDYTTTIVSSGRHALELLQESKYVAVILNVEQENENSLLLLQQIKNNKVTRNIPVIVFSVEAEKEKIFLMGSVEYLVKPINYNNLVEILTSYKLRRNSLVLCVDDDNPTLNLLKQAVQTAGFNVIAQNRPELVLDEISDKDIDLAIIDLDMPILNGFDLIKKIKALEKFSKLPIIIYTGKEDYQEDLEKIDGMFIDLLDKRSTSFNELENTITAMIKSYEEPIKPEDKTDDLHGPKILMAEDYKHSQIIVTRLLKKSGFENVIVVENGEEALNICESDKVDLILMDMQMPVMNGFEATGKIRDLEGYADTPIIALTAFAMKGDREKCLEAGATDYIPKPIDSIEFIEKVKYYTQITIPS